jgi:hypothetical protein
LIEVMAFPTLRWYREGQAIIPNYKMDRTVESLMEFARQQLEMETFSTTTTTASFSVEAEEQNQAHAGYEEEEEEAQSDKKGDQSSQDEDLIDGFANDDEREDDLADHVQALDEVQGENGVNMVDLTEANWDVFFKSNPNAFVNLCAPRSDYCQSLAPTWEKFATEVKKQKMEVVLGKVDCEAQGDLCHKTDYPTMSWYKEGQPIIPGYMIREDYTNYHTVESLIDFARQQLAIEVLEEDQTLQPEGKERSAKKLIRIHGAGRN